MGKLDGQAAQALAWASLILVKAQTIEQARGFSENGLQDMTKALQAARQID